MFIDEYHNVQISAAKSFILYLNLLLSCFHIGKTILTSATHNYFTAQSSNLMMHVNLPNPLKVWISDLKNGMKPYRSDMLNIGVTSITFRSKRPCLSLCVYTYH